MIFDKLCAICEKFNTPALKALHDARIFNFPYRSHEIFSGADGSPTISNDELAAMRDMFFLPFPVIAVEDTASCIVMWDSEKDQQGFGKTRYFIECMSVHSSSEEFNDDEEVIKQVREQNVASALGITDPDACYVNFGRFLDLEVIPQEDVKNRLLFKGHGDMFFIASKREMFFKPVMFSQVDPRAEQAVLRNVLASVCEVFYFNQPNRFILEATPKKCHDDRPVQPGRVLRSPFRRQYTILKPDEIRERLGLPPSGSGGPKAPHERRRHTRTYKADRYVEMKGKTVVIPATWIGPSEAVVKGTKYKVLLDI